MRYVDHNGKDCGVWRRGPGATVYSETDREAERAQGWQRTEDRIHNPPSDEINVSAARSGAHPIARSLFGPLLVGVLLLAALVGGCWIATRKGAARIYPVPSAEITVSPVKS